MALEEAVELGRIGCGFLLTLDMLQAIEFRVDVMAEHFILRTVIEFVAGFFASDEISDRGADEARRDTFSSKPDHA